MTSNAPIALFVYNRPEHTRKTLEHLTRNTLANESELFVFSDAPKSHEHNAGVDSVRQIVKEVQWCGKVTLVEREKNLGCAHSVIQGVTEICERYGRVIVMEDDLITSHHFLSYMNLALNTYVDNARVMQISGHMFPIRLDCDADAFFMPFTTSWGWATWQRSWKHFDPRMLAYEKLKKNYRLRYKFNLQGSYPYLKMLKSQLAGDIDSWAIRWYLSFFFQNGLTLYPKESLVNNIGFDGSGTHCGISINLCQSLVSETRLDKLPKLLEVDKDSFYRVRLHFMRQKIWTSLKHLYSKLSTVG